MKTVRLTKNCNLEGDNLPEGTIIELSDMSAFQLVDSGKAEYQKPPDPILNRELERGHP